MKVLRNKKVLDFLLTLHAQNRMEGRSISKDEIAFVLNHGVRRMINQHKCRIKTQNIIIIADIKQKEIITVYRTDCFPLAVIMNMGK